MKTKLSLQNLPSFLLFVAASFSPPLLAQGTVFTYHGRVTDNGANFTGAGQFKFALVTVTNANHIATATASPPSGDSSRLIAAVFTTFAIWVDAATVQWPSCSTGWKLRQNTNLTTATGTAAAIASQRWRPQIHHCQFGRGELLWPA